MKLVFVVGPMSSGCRILRNVLEDSPSIQCWLDTSHGTKIPPVENSMIIPDEAIPIVILREKQAVKRSQLVRWSREPEYISYEESMKNIKKRYPNAFTVHYEDLCNDVQSEINKIAQYLGIDSWHYTGSKFVNQNKKWAGKIEYIGPGPIMEG